MAALTIAATWLLVAAILAPVVGRFCAGPR